MEPSPGRPKEDPMVVQDIPKNKMNRGLLYGVIIVIVIIRTDSSFLKREMADSNANAASPK